MTILARLVRFLIWVLVVFWSVALVRRLVAWLVGSAQSKSRMREDARGSPGRQLHRDPVCGMHVAEEISLQLRETGGTVYFCSPECRDRYVGGQRKAANA